MKYKLDAPSCEVLENVLTSVVNDDVSDQVGHLQLCTDVE